MPGICRTCGGRLRAAFGVSGFCVGKSPCESLQTVQHDQPVTGRIFAQWRHGAVTPLRYGAIGGSPCSANTFDKPLSARA
jgi:hypothetical protein